MFALHRFAGTGADVPTRLARLINDTFYYFVEAAINVMRCHKNIFRIVTFIYDFLPISQNRSLLTAEVLYSSRISSAASFIRLLSVKLSYYQL